MSKSGYIKLCFTKLERLNSIIGLTRQSLVRDIDDQECQLRSMRNTIKTVSGFVKHIKVKSRIRELAVSYKSPLSSGGVECSSPRL